MAQEKIGKVIQILKELANLSLRLANLKEKIDILKVEKISTIQIETSCSDNKVILFFMNSKGITVTAVKHDVKENDVKINVYDEKVIEFFKKWAMKKLNREIKEINREIKKLQKELNKLIS